MNHGQLSLWRGPSLLGQLMPYRFSEERERPNVPAKAPLPSWILVPLLDASGLEPMMQTMIPIMPGRPVFQHRTEPMDCSPTAESPQRTGASSGHVELQPLSPEEAAGVPKAEQFSIRDDTGAVFSARMIVIREMRYGANIEKVAGLMSLPSGAAVDGTVWMVSAALEERMMVINNTTRIL